MTDTSIEKFKQAQRSFYIITSGGREWLQMQYCGTGFDLFKSARKEEYGYGIMIT